MVHLRALWVCLVVAGGLALAGTAAASCTPNRQASGGRWWSRMIVGPQQLENCVDGTYANILNSNPYIYPQGDTTSAWVMLLDWNTGAFAQVGWIKLQNGTRHNFTEVYSAETNWHSQRVDDYTADAVGSTPQYKMTYTSSNNLFHFYWGGVDRYDFSSPSYAGCSAEQAGEIHNLASQMPGLSANPDTFTNTTIHHGNYSGGGSWYESNSWSTYTGDKYGNRAGSFGNQTFDPPPFFIHELDIWDTCS